MSTLPVLRTRPAKPFAWIMAGALTATALDLLFAAIYWELRDVSTTRVMQSIAAQWGWGRDAYSGGTATAVLGAVVFFARMLVLAAICQGAARRYAVWTERPYVCGALFGLAVYLVDRYAVVPLIQATPPSTAPTDWAWMSACILAHMLLIGIPLALFARASTRNDE